MKQLMKLSAYRAKRYADPKPAINTLKKWIDDGILAGKKIGNLYFVEVDEETASTGNELADRILAG